MVNKKWKSVSIYLIVFVLAFLIGVFTTQSKYKKEISLLKSNAIKEIEVIDSKLDKMRERESEYLLLEEKKNAIKDSNTSIQSKHDSITLIKKDKINEEVSKMDLNDMSLYLNSLGYYNTIISIRD